MDCRDKGAYFIYLKGKMLHIKLFFIRKIKGLAIKAGLHHFIEPFNKTLLTLVYLSKLSNLTTGAVK